MIEVFQPLAIVAASVLIVSIGWSALSIQRTISLIPLFLLSTLAGAEIAFMLNSVDLFALEFSFGFAFLTPLAAVLLGLASLMALWTLRSYDDVEHDHRQQSPPSAKAGHANIARPQQTIIVSDTILGVPALRVSAYLAVAAMALLIFFNVVA